MTKKKITVPIILLTAKGEVENRIQGLELGADDYLGKPFEPKELLLRINNIIKKNKKININKVSKIGEAIVDLNKMFVQLKDKKSKINNSEKKVLLEMLSNPGKTYSRIQIGQISNITQERFACPSIVSSKLLHISSQVGLRQSQEEKELLEIQRKPVLTAPHQFTMFKFCIIYY